MAWTNVGFDGTINEAQWSALAGLLGNGYVAAGNGDCLVTAVPGARSVSVAAGSLYGDGVLSTNSGAETVAMTTPVNGQWYVIALRRTWATNTAALVAIAGATTTTTTPTAPPTSFPTLNTNVGVLTDQPIAWAWCNSANTTVVVYDIRLKAVKSLPPVVANQGERDAKFMIPTQGLQVWRDDLGAVETYFGLYNASTNPGGRDTAGWYSNNRSGGLIPVRATTATIVSGSGSANSLGVVSFSGATKVTLQNIFTSEYDNYKILISGVCSLTQPLYMRYIQTDGSEQSYTAYVWEFLQAAGSSIAANRYVNTTQLETGYFYAAGSPSQNEIFITKPFIETYPTQYMADTNFGNGTEVTYQKHIGLYAGAQRHIGVSLFPGNGTMTGTVQVFGYND